jgi:hypothetical protein
MIETMDSLQAAYDVQQSARHQSEILAAWNEAACVYCATERLAIALMADALMMAVAQ